MADYDSENDRLNAAQAALWGRVLEGDSDAMDVFVRLIERRRVLLGEGGSDVTPRGYTHPMGCTCGPTEIHVHNHLGGIDEEAVDAKLTEILEAIAALRTENGATMADLSRITSEVSEATTTMAGAAVLIRNLAAEIRANATDPVALEALATQLDGAETDLSSAVAENTPEAPTEPEPETPVEPTEPTEPEAPVDPPVVDPEPETPADGGDDGATADTPDAPEAGDPDAVNTFP